LVVLLVVRGEQFSAPAEPDCWVFLSEMKHLTTRNVLAIGYKMERMTVAVKRERNSTGLTFGEFDTSFGRQDASMSATHATSQSILTTGPEAAVRLADVFQAAQVAEKTTVLWLGRSILGRRGKPMTSCINYIFKPPLANFLCGLGERFEFACLLTKRGCIADIEKLTPEADIWNKTFSRSLCYRKTQKHRKCQSSLRCCALQQRLDSRELAVVGYWRRAFAAHGDTHYQAPNYHWDHERVNDKRPL